VAEIMVYEGRLNGWYGNVDPEEVAMVIITWPLEESVLSTLWQRLAHVTCSGISNC
jgi:hypothetical protein